MFKIAIVVFRECLEISLLLGVIMAVTKPIHNSKVYITLGAMMGIVGAAIFAIFIRSISDSFGGLGDEMVNASIILITALLISWTVVWMQGYTQKVRKDLSTLSDKIETGSASKFMLVAMVAMTILREGAEIILFVYSISSAENITGNNYLLGLGVGAISGVSVGVIVYNGLINYAGKYIFRISTMLLILIAAGLASEAAGILTSSGIIEIYSNQLWDSSWLVTDQSTVGKILKIIIGYDARPNGLQLLCYLSTIMLTISMMLIKAKMFSRKYV